MPRTLLPCLTIVAAFSLRPVAAEPGSVTVPVSQATIALLQTHDLAPDPDPARFLTGLTRLLYSGADNRAALLDALRRLAAARDAKAREPAFVVSLPLPLETWNRTIFRREVAPDILVAAIAADRGAALLLHGLLGLDDETLEYLRTHPSLLGRLYEGGAPAFAGFADSLVIRSARVVPPGGAASAVLWEAVVGAPVTDVTRFVSLLFGSREGRVAYLYDTISKLGPAGAAFALGAALPEGARLPRFQALAAVAMSQYGEWKIDQRPFARPTHDLALLLWRLRLDADGRPSAPAERNFWSQVFDAPLEGDAASNDPDAAVDAAWLARATGGGHASQRGERMNQFVFGQRVFADVDPSQRAAALDAVKLFRSYPTLMLTLERLGIRQPSAYVRAARQAARLDLGDASRGFWQIAQLQSALALLARMHGSGTLEADTAGTLVESLFGVPLERGRYGGALVAWVARELVPRLPKAPDVESRLIGGLAGAGAGGAAPRIFWEGQSYKVDLGLAESRRIAAVRAKQGGYTVDLALALDEAARRLSEADPASGDQSAAVAALAAVRDRFRAELGRVVDVVPPGVEPFRSAREVVEQVLADLSVSSRARESRRAARAAAVLADLTDIVLGEALLTLNYAAELGSPDGPALLARNVSLRHDFGFGRHGDDRARMAWSLPRQSFQPGLPWHVAGSALGLDVALARMSLNRHTSDRLPGAPKLSSLERDGFAVGVALMRPVALRDADRDAIRAALARGRARARAIAARADDGAFEQMAAELGLDGWRRRAIRQALADDPQQAAGQFSLVELLILGGVNLGDAASGVGGVSDVDLDAWGMSALQTAGCLCTRMLSPRSWRLLGGRGQMALGSAAVPDLHLRVAEMLSELDLPSVLVQPVLAGAVDEFTSEASPGDPDDWWALARTAGGWSRERIEDYVASTASIDGALVPDETAGSGQP
jgi:hypothetical protein